MMRHHRIRRLVAALAASAAALAAGCSADDDAPNEPQPTGYQQPPEDLCEQVQFDEVLRQWELAVPPGQDTDSDYQTERAWWYARCNFIGQADDGRFATELGEFQPTGAVTFWVYQEVDDAVEKYDQDATSYIEGPEEGEPAEITGWWDTGISVELAEAVNPDDYSQDDLEATSLDALRLVRHENLVALGYVDALSPTGQVDEASALLREILAGVLDESVAHLPREPE